MNNKLTHTFFSYSININIRSSYIFFVDSITLPIRDVSFIFMEPHFMNKVKEKFIFRALPKTYTT